MQNLPTNLDEVEKHLRMLPADSKMAVWAIPLKQKQYDTLFVYFDSHFRDTLSNSNKKFWKKVTSDPNQLYKCLRNIQHGFDVNYCKVDHGKDGIYKIDLHNKKYDNFMTRMFESKILLWCTNDYLTSTYSFITQESSLIPVRIVAHPKNVKVRPLGYLVINPNSKTQHLILLDVAVSAS